MFYPCKWFWVLYDVLWLDIILAIGDFFSCGYVSAALSVQNAPFYFISKVVHYLYTYKCFLLWKLKLFPCDKCTLDVCFVSISKYATVVTQWLWRVVNFTHNFLETCGTIKTIVITTFESWPGPWILYCKIAYQFM